MKFSFFHFPVISSDYETSVETRSLKVGLTTRSFQTFNTNQIRWFVNTICVNNIFMLKWNFFRSFLLRYWIWGTQVKEPLNGAQMVQIFQLNLCPFRNFSQILSTADPRNKYFQTKSFWFGFFVEKATSYNIAEEYYTFNLTKQLNQCWEVQI